MGFLLVVKAEVVRSLIIMRRYWFATATGILMGYGILIGLVFAFMYNREMVADVMAQRATNVSLGLIIGMFAFGIVGMFTQGLQGMARTGELEQLCMSPHGLVTNFLARSLVTSVTTILSSAVMIWLVAATVKGKLHADPLPTVILLFLTYLNLIGFGFMAGGLVLVFKQTGQIAVLIRLSLIALAVGASDNMAQWPPVMQWVAHILPITDAALCLKLVVIQGAGTAVFSHPSFYFLLASCLIWTFLGIACFRFFEDWSRDKGTLGSY
jgi:hypothetical protein